MTSFMTLRLIRKKSIFEKKSGILGLSQKIIWYFLLTILLENQLEITHVDF